MKFFWGFVFLLAICIRLVFVLPESKLDNNDSQLRYDPQAKNLISGHGFSTSHEAPYVPDTFDLPGYAFFLGMVYRIGNYNLHLLAVIQALLEFLTVYILWRITL